MLLPAGPLPGRCSPKSQMPKAISKLEKTVAISSVRIFYNNDVKWCTGICKNTNEFHKVRWKKPDERV